MKWENVPGLGFVISCTLNPYQKISNGNCLENLEDGVEVGIGERGITEEVVVAAVVGHITPTICLQGGDKDHTDTRIK